MCKMLCTQCLFVNGDFFTLLILGLRRNRYFAKICAIDTDRLCV